MNAAISRGIRGGQIHKVVWKPERHLNIEIYTDASLYQYGGLIDVKGEHIQIAGFRDQTQRGKPIMVLRAVRSKIASHRVDAYIDNKVSFVTRMG
ncbi:hypothetical protein MAR_014745 [Mya arenaria]|uniref:Uncharacterized protein n=1 Tax=Mya arenaria TaxID=6604 RepID=A0ABY7FNH7_MYAAR|nr:hypothetical protein MAR_014745 [Mya arenaria]